jgi:ribosome silencing factor RsfS/YbeB/iojap
MLILFIVTLISKTLTNKKECLDESVHILISQGCFDVQVVELSKDAFTDYIILSSATSQRQILATVSKLKALFRLSNAECKTEGETTSWALISGENIVINILTEEARDFYSLGDLYFDCKITNIDT